MSRKSIKSDLAKLDRLKDRDIDYSEIPPLDPSFFTKATATMRRDEDSRDQGLSRALRRANPL